MDPQTPVRTPIKEAMARRISGAFLNLIACIIAAGIFALSLTMLWQTRQDTWREAEQASSNLLSAVTRDIGGNIRIYDLYLQRVINGLGANGFRELPPHLQQQFLFDQTETMGYMWPIIVTNAAGDIVRDASSIPPRTGNFADRDYFRIHRDRADAGLYVSKPYRNRLRKGEWAISISRRLSDAQGHFAGIVAASLSLTRIDDAFARLNLGQSGAITLLRDDGTVIMRQPLEESVIGRDFSASPNTSRALTQDAGAFVGSSVVDGVRRHYVFRHIDGLPLIVMVATSVDDILAPWRRKALVLSVSTLVLCFAVVALTFLFQRELRRRTLAEAELETLATTDSLTGLPNRRAFDGVYAREWAAALRQQRPLSLLFIDADSFKSYNDHYGHGEGDALLCALADVLRAHLVRTRHYPARYGGEEFMILLPETDGPEAVAIAEKVRRAVLKLGVRHVRSRFGVLTVSIGVATLVPRREQPPASLIEAADRALYGAKAAGRNMVRQTSTSDAAAAEPAFPERRESRAEGATRRGLERGGA